MTAIAESLARRGADTASDTAEPNSPGQRPLTIFQAAAALCTVFAFIWQCLVVPMTAVRDDVHDLKTRLAAYDTLVQRVDTHENRFAAMDQVKIQRDAEIADLRQTTQRHEAELQAVDSKLTGIVTSLDEIKTRLPR